MILIDIHLLKEESIQETDLLLYALVVLGGEVSDTILNHLNACHHNIE